MPLVVKIVLFLGTITCISASVDVSIRQRYCNSQSIDQNSDADTAITEVLHDVIDRTSSSPRYDVVSKKEHGSATFWAEGICGYGMTSNDCYICKTMAWFYLDEDCRLKAGGRITLAACKLRYETYRFDLDGRW
ncbi:hypothetical protein MLD38_003191 [Melastoma candidum]|uniref:Uncharacterized protein n=1 Tax=Melastoma candidum TaxID=119954 RepID=A0ACB9SAC3_9MYRT|nr:hypothetical protein MLD38_003191 [Melastoma candidum]